MILPLQWILSNSKTKWMLLFCHVHCAGLTGRYRRGKGNMWNLLRKLNKRDRKVAASISPVLWYTVSSEPGWAGMRRMPGGWRLNSSYMWRGWRGSQVAWLRKEPEWPNTDKMATWINKQKQNTNQKKPAPRRGKWNAKTVASRGVKINKGQRDLGKQASCMQQWPHGNLSLPCMHTLLWRCTCTWQSNDGEVRTRVKWFSWDHMSVLTYMRYLQY